MVKAKKERNLQAYANKVYSAIYPLEKAERKKVLEAVSELIK